mmetsp:Transcript_23230/g.34776  ORF Transcript_23230/g.34776 Transcript_23230/m.34776 type:complete len:123 (+) Transcript_23230:1598-1966(+)
MHYAARHGKMEVVAYVLEIKANIEAKNNDGETPIHWAASRGFIEVVIYLYESKVDIEAKDNEGLTPLDYAQKHRREDITKFLQNKIEERIKRILERDLPFELRMLHSSIVNIMTKRSRKRKR